MCAKQHNDLVENDPLLVEAERHARALLAEADVMDDDPPGLDQVHDAYGPNDDEPDTEPYLIRTQAEIEGYPPFPFPNRTEVEGEPDGWDETRELFCDSLGVGRQGEAALTIEQLKAELRPGFAYAITGEGQFQVYVTEYKRVDVDTDDLLGLGVDSRIRTPIEDSKYGYPCNPSSHPNADKSGVRHVTGNVKGD